MFFFFFFFSSYTSCTDVSTHARQGCFSADQPSRRSVSHCDITQGSGRLISGLFILNSGGKIVNSVFLLWGDLGVGWGGLLSFPSTMTLSSTPLKPLCVLERRNPQSLQPGFFFFFNVASNSAIKRPSGVSPRSRSPAPDSDLLLPPGRTTLGACQRSHDNRDS